MLNLANKKKIKTKKRYQFKHMGLTKMKKTLIIHDCRKGVENRHSHHFCWKCKWIQPL